MPVDPPSFLRSLLNNRYSWTMVRRTLFVIAALLGLLGSPVLGQVVFSEYVEGSGHNKALEILNIGPEPVGLDGQGCRVRMYFNGHMEPGLEIQLRGRLPPGEVLVLYHEQGDAPAFLEAVRSAKNLQGSGFG